MSFVPFSKMDERVKSDRSDSDATLFIGALMYYGEYSDEADVVSGLLAATTEERRPPPLSHCISASPR